MKKTGLKGSVKFFSVDFNPIDTNNILDILRYAMKGIKYKIMFGVIKKMSVVLLTNIFNAFNQANYVSLSNRKCKIPPTLIKLDRRVGSCNNLNDISNKVCVPNKTECFI